jgi:hypothetical protein
MTNGSAAAGNRDEPQLKHVRVCSRPHPPSTVYAVVTTADSRMADVRFMPR